MYKYMNIHLYVNSQDEYTYSVSDALYSMYRTHNGTVYFVGYMYQVWKNQFYLQSSFHNPLISST